MLGIIAIVFCWYVIIKVVVAVGNFFSFLESPRERTIAEQIGDEIDRNR